MQPELFHQYNSPIEFLFSFFKVKQRYKPQSIHRVRLESIHGIAAEPRDTLPIINIQKSAVRFAPYYYEYFIIGIVFSSEYLGHTKKYF